MVPGNRWMAGFSRNAASSAAGSIEAIASRVQPADAARERQRAGERLLDGHLLVERVPDEEREGVARDEGVRLRIAGEREGWPASFVMRRMVARRRDRPVTPEPTVDARAVTAGRRLLHEPAPSSRR